MLYFKRSAAIYIQAEAWTISRVCSRLKRDVLQLILALCQMQLTSLFSFENVC